MPEVEGPRWNNPRANAAHPVRIDCREKLPPDFAGAQAAKIRLAIATAVAPTARTLSNLLVLFAHPAIRQSRVQKPLRAAAAANPHVTVHDLYEAYPDFEIDIDAEQRLLEAHDIVIFQHPFYWYSVPPLIKQWFDLVLEHGWAYGSQGEALQGKQVGVAISAGGNATSYRPDGLNRYTIQELLRPIEATMNLCGMHWLPPFLVTGTHSIEAAEITTAAKHYDAWLTHLATGTLNEASLAANDAMTAMQEN